MPRISFSGPRILNGLVRPGISFSTRELAAVSKRAPKADPKAVTGLGRRPDGGIIIQSPSFHDDHGADSDDGCVPVCMFNFINQSEADEIRAGALVRLAKHVGSDGWITGLSIGKVVAACRAEIAAMGFITVFTHVTPAMLARIAAAETAPPEQSTPIWVVVSCSLVIVVICLLFAIK